MNRGRLSMLMKINEQNNDIYKERFTFWFVLGLILNGYATGIPGVSLGSAVYAVIILISLIKGIRSGKMFANSFVISFGALLTVSSLVGMTVLCFLHPSITFSIPEQITGLAKLFIWVLMAGVVVRQYYNETIFTKWMVRFAIVLTIYIYIQSIAFYGGHIYLPNIFNVGPLRPYADGYADYLNLGAGSILRPAAFFSESSFYGNYIICTTALYLNKYADKLRGKNTLFIIFISGGIVLSGSTSGIILQGFIMFVFFRKLKANLRWQIGLFVLLSAIVLIALWLNGLSGSAVGNSIQYSFAKFDYLDRSTRFGKSYGYLNFIPKCIFFIGAGIGNGLPVLRYLTGTDSIYLNSITLLLIETGIIGCVFFAVFIFVLLKKSYKQRNLVSLSLLTVYCVKGMASGIYFSTYGILFIFICMGQILMEGNKE